MAWLLALLLAVIWPPVARAGTGPEAGPQAQPTAAPHAILTPRLVRVELGPSLSLSALHEQGLDVIEVRRGHQAVLLEWPGDDATLARLGAAVTLLDPEPGRTAALRARAELAARPAPPPARVRSAARPDGVFRTESLPPFGSGSMGGYWTRDEVKMKLDQLVADDVHDVVADQVDTLALSVEYRPIWELRLGKRVSGPDTRPVVVYNALMHAREPGGMQTLLYFVDDLLSRYGTDPVATHLLDHRVISIVPVANPDGYQWNEDYYVNSGIGAFGYWRKNLEDNNLNGINDAKDGVDVNRNFGYKWGYDNEGSSGSWGSQDYRGTEPWSEPESAAQRDLIVALRPKCGLSFHTFSDLLVHPWGYAPLGTPDSAAFYEWDDVLTLGNGYQSGPAPRVLYSVNGDFNDWLYGDTLLKPRGFSWTPEIGGPDDGFWPPPSRILPLAQENLRACYAVAAMAGSWVQVERCDLAEGALNAGHLAHLAVRARNRGMAPTATGLTATLTALDPATEVLSGPVPYPVIGSRQSADASGGARFLVAAADTVTPGRLLRFRVDFTDADGSFSRDTVDIPCGTATVVFADDAANGLGLWTTTSWGIVTGDPMHPSAYFADSPLGLYGANSNNPLLVTAPLDLSAGVHAYARFEARWSFESDYDCGLVEASLDGTNWTPLAGRATTPGARAPGVQPVGQPVYDGARWLWAGERVDLSGFTGPTATAVRFRFRALSDAGYQFDGLDVDSVRILLYDPAAQPAPAAVSGGPAPAALALAAPSPNPARGRTTLEFTLAGAAAVRLEVLDLQGRRVAVLADATLPAGHYRRGWDLHDDHGRVVAPGVYLARLSGGAGTVVRRLAVLR